MQVPAVQARGCAAGSKMIQVHYDDGNGICRACGAAIEPRSLGPRWCPGYRRRVPRGGVGASLDMGGGRDERDGMPGGGEVDMGHLRRFLGRTGGGRSDRAARRRR